MKALLTGLSAMSISLALLLIGCIGIRQEFMPPETAAPTRDLVEPKPLPTLTPWKLAVPTPLPSLIPKRVTAPPLRSVSGRSPFVVGDAFAFRLLHQAIAATPGQNVFISPMSVSLVLCMTYNGARGETAEAMARVLGIEGLSLEELNDANASLPKPGLAGGGRGVVYRQLGLDPARMGLPPRLYGVERPVLWGARASARL